MTRATMMGVSATESDAAEQVLARCPLCTVFGPKAKLEQHVREDHAEKPTLGWTVSIDPELRAPLEEIRQRFGLTFAALINAAVRLHLRRLRGRGHPE